MEPKGKWECERASRQKFRATRLGRLVLFRSGWKSQGVAETNGERKLSKIAIQVFVKEKAIWQKNPWACEDAHDQRFIEFITLETGSGKAH